MINHNKVGVGPVVQVNVYRVLEEAVDTGIMMGLRRGDKHSDDPLTDAQQARMHEHIEREVMNALSEVLIFP